MTDFAGILEAQLARIDAGDAAARQALYKRLTEALKAAHARGGAERSLTSDMLGLQMAFEEIEARFRPPDAAPKPPPTFRARLVERTRRVFKKTEAVIAKGKRIAAVLALLLPIGGFAYWFFVSTEERLPQVQRSAIEASACVVLPRETCDGLIAAIERTKSATVIKAANAGDLKPAEDALRAQARRVEQDPNATEGEKAQARVDSALIASSLRSIADAVTRTAATAERIEKNTAELKRETSTDPRKELVNRGQTWDQFQSAFVRCQLDDLKLYKQAGARITKEDFIFLLAFTRATECLELFRDQFAAEGPEACFSDDYFRPRGEDTQMFIGFRNNRRDLIRDIGKVPGRLAFAESICGADRMRRGYPGLYATSQREAAPQRR